MFEVSLAAYTLFLDHPNEYTRFHIENIFLSSEILRVNEDFAHHVDYPFAS